MIRKLFYLVFFSITLCLLQGQDPIFSQISSSPLVLNPAFTGLSEDPRFAVNYRNQWTSLPANYVTYSGSYDQFFKDYNSGVGLVLLMDNAGNGIYKTLKIGLNYSYRVQIDRKRFLRLGIEAAYDQNTLDWDKLIFLDQIHPVSGVSDVVSGEIRPDNNTAGNFDAGAGVLYYNSDFFIGLGAKHLNASKRGAFDVNANSYGRLSPRYTLISGFEFDLPGRTPFLNKAILVPIVALIKQGDFYQINAGATLELAPLRFGTHYRHTSVNGDAIILSAGLEYDDQIRFTYSYDITISSIPMPTGGSHEIGLIYIWGYGE